MTPMVTVNPRETKEYKQERVRLSEFPDTKIILTTVYELLKDMKYKNALDNPSRTIQPEEYCLLDEIRARL